MSRDFFREWQQKKQSEQPSEDSREQASELGACELEDFQWTEDRERAIGRLLETTTPGTLPSVHLQLESIRRALGQGLALSRAEFLLAEVSAYLRELREQEERKPAVLQAQVQSAHQDKLSALAAWEEACGALRQYLQEREEIHLQVAAYASDQACGFLAGARQLLLLCEAEEAFLEEAE